MDIFDINIESKESPEFVSRQVVRSRYLFLDLAPKREESFVLTCAGREECSADYHLDRDGFHYYAVEFVLSGQWELEWDGVVHELGPGSVFAYRPDSVFSLRACGSEAQVKYFVDFSGADAASELAACGLELGQPSLVMPIRWIQDIFDQMLDCNRYPKQVAMEMGGALTRMLLMRIREDARLHSLPNQDSFETYQRCLNYIREHFKSLQTMEALGQACHVDRAYLSRLFKKHGGESPYQLLIRMKMEYAAELLRYRHLSVKATAGEVGFADPFHFSRVFKKTFGLSPRHFVKG